MQVRHRRESTLASQLKERRALPFVFRLRYGPQRCKRWYQRVQQVGLISQVQLHLPWQTRKHFALMCKATLEGGARGEHAGACSGNTTNVSRARQVGQQPSRPSSQNTVTATLTTKAGGMYQTKAQPGGNGTMKAITSLGRLGSAGRDAQSGVVARPAAPRIFSQRRSTPVDSAQPPDKGQQMTTASLFRNVQDFLFDGCLVALQGRVSMEMP